MKRPIRFSVGAIIFLIVFATALYTQRVRISDLIREADAPNLPEAVGYEEINGQEESEDSEEPEESKDLEAIVEIEEENTTKSFDSSDTSDSSDSFGLPASFNLAVPFTSQAPFANWDALHEETCEEASVYMVAAYYRGVSGTIAPQTAEDELQRLVALENDLFGSYEDTTALETARLATEAYGLRAQIENDPTVESIKAHIAAGRPVITPAAGRLLGNPNFTGDGPPYHMLVIRGYADGNFIANDPGTRRGEQYVYSEVTIMNAIHDWTGSYETIDTGSKVILVVYPD